MLYLQVALTNSEYFTSPSYFDVFVKKPLASLERKNSISFQIDKNGKTDKLRFFRLKECKLGMMFSSKFKDKMNKMYFNNIEL